MVQEVVWLPQFSPFKSATQNKSFYADDVVLYVPQSHRNPANINLQIKHIKAKHLQLS